ncbi:MAG: hypothetical protein IIW82_00015 [Clostridia bacterium]|nr:hypothetical protein [Clostridia bacterium]
MFRESEEGRKYLEYNEKVGGEPIGLMIPIGSPAGVEEMGGVIAVYEECIRRGITWEELLDFHIPDDAVM